jgi:hypothetical protein
LRSLLIGKLFVLGDRFFLKLRLILIQNPKSINPKLINPNF